MIFLIIGAIVLWMILGWGAGCLVAWMIKDNYDVPRMFIHIISGPIGVIVVIIVGVVVLCDKFPFSIDFSKRK